MTVMTGLEWRRNPAKELIAHIDGVRGDMGFGVFFRVFPALSGGFWLWLITPGTTREHLGWHASEGDAQDAAEKYAEEKRW
jgi:hypothetical protein